MKRAENGSGLHRSADPKNGIAAEVETKLKIQRNLFINFLRDGESDLAAKSPPVNINFFTGYSKSALHFTLCASDPIPK